MRLLARMYGYSQSLLCIFNKTFSSVVSIPLAVFEQKTDGDSALSIESLAANCYIDGSNLSFQGDFLGIMTFVDTIKQNPTKATATTIKA